MLLKLVILLVYSTIFVCAMNENLSEYKASNTAGGKTYYVVNDKVNFFGAFVGCQEAGMDLATVKSPVEEAVLEELLVSFGVNVTWAEGFWLSGSNLPDVTRSMFYWFSGGSNIVYSNWIPGEPDNAGAQEHCIMWAAYGPYKGWNDYPCESPLRYVCEVAS